MLIYSVTAVLVFSFITYVFGQDDEAAKDDVQSWLFIALAASIWPVTLPNMVRKVVKTSMKRQRLSHAPYQQSALAMPALQKTSR